MAFCSLIHFASEDERSSSEVTLGVDAIVTALTRETSVEEVEEVVAVDAGCWRGAVPVVWNARVSMDDACFEVMRSEVVGLNSSVVNIAQCGYWSDVGSLFSGRAAPGI